ncbi:Uncharacterised protein [Vibrio cholerae]|nr:Uncharacterised protein [Vibrio cholerae]
MVSSKELLGNISQVFDVDTTDRELTIQLIDGVHHVFGISDPFLTELGKQRTC